MNERLVSMALGGLEDAPTMEQIRRVAAAVIAVKGNLFPGDDTTESELVRVLEERCLVWVPSGGILDDPKGHVEWLSGKRAEIDWAFWDRYEEYLEKRLNWPRQVVRRLDEVTDEILGRIEDPRRSGEWDRRGLVVGRVQSGKTSTYIGLINKAADSGYKLIVILAGLHNSLRSQTQVRLDDGFLGFDTQKRLRVDRQNTKLGVGSMPGAPDLVVHSLTSSANAGDFSLLVAQTQNVMIGGSDPVVLVVKKNKTILENLHHWATTLRQVEDPTTGRRIVRDVPLLVIDDEADNASVNTADPGSDVPTDENGQPIEEYDPSKLNGLIRKFLIAFEKRAYIGYTATPFANILSQWNESTSEFGEGLFPRSFIVNLRPPSNYIGPERVFGLSRDVSETGEAAPGLPVLRPVDDSEDWVPGVHKKTLRVGDLPDSLVEAVDAFLLASAARAARGQVAVHNSMLVHVTRFTAVQNQISEQLKELTDDLRRRLRYGDGESTDQLVPRLRALWERDFAPTTRAFPDEQPLNWADVQAQLWPSAARILVKQINGTAKDVLEYVESAATGVTVIAVGGDKLSRGLTLEGLSVSYFLRASRMYDTLMQMGRWFGYRPGYADLCRLYTTDELIGWFAQITNANEELMQLFDEMVASGATPDEFGLKVRLSPDGLTVTAPQKMRRGKKVSVCYTDSTPETTIFSLRESTLKANFQAAANLISDLGLDEAAPILGARPTDKPSLIWRGVGPDPVIRFLASYRTHEQALSSNSRIIETFVRAHVGLGELSRWTVVLVSVANKDATRVGPAEIGAVTRSPINQNPVRDYSIRRIVSPSDEILDLDDKERERALAATIASWEAQRQLPGDGRVPKDTPRPSVPVGWAARSVRPRERALMLIYVIDASEYADERLVGFAISFSGQGSKAPIDYVVNEVYWAHNFGWEERA